MKQLFRRRQPTTTLPGEDETQANDLKQNKDSLTVLTCAKDTDTNI